MTSATSKQPLSLIGWPQRSMLFRKTFFIAFSKLEVDDGLLDVERWTEVLRDFGFGSSPETAEDFVRSFIADRMMRRG